MENRVCISKEEHQLKETHRNLKCTAAILLNGIKPNMTRPCLQCWLSYFKVLSREELTYLSSFCRSSGTLSLAFIILYKV